jgi:S-DNA-T family DNA segregation ATPase FtsK/SpoIIIE
MTGAGKSVFLMGMILGLIFKHTPEDLRFIIMAGMPELVYFRKLPHLLGPLHYFEEYGMEVLNILKWLEEERDKRLSLMESAGYLDLARYNLWSYVKNRYTLPHIVFILDHYFTFRFSDRRSTTPALKEVDPVFVRLVQTAHPAGIHIVLTNQTPSFQDMSIALKESFQARAGFAQVQPNASVMALGTSGAEYLKSGGDMLFRMNQDSPYERYQACNVEGDEAVRVVEFWRKQT